MAWPTNAMAARCALLRLQFRMASLVADYFIPTASWVAAQPGVWIHKSRAPELTPSLMWCPNLDPNRLHTTAVAPLTQHERTVVIFEFGHTSDKLMVETMEDKCRQHAAWAEHWRGQADPWEVVVYPVVISHSGLLPQTLADGLVACGLTAQAAKRAVNRVVAATVSCTDRMWRTRRKLLHELDRPDPG